MDLREKPTNVPCFDTLGQFEEGREESVIYSRDTRYHGITENLLEMFNLNLEKVEQLG